jgi:hypothetical protein
MPPGGFAPSVDLDPHAKCGMTSDANSSRVSMSFLFSAPGHETIKQTRDRAILGQCIIRTQISGILDIARTMAVVPMLPSAAARC